MPECGLMTILLITPGSIARHSGNRCTASQWADLLKELGHEVIICYDIPSTLPAAHTHLLIAMHGAKCHDVIGLYQRAEPEGKVLLALTGTDIYPEPLTATRESISRADGIIVLQKNALEKIPPDLRSKTTVVVQSVQKRVERSACDTGFFEVCVVGHFRDVKNPLLTARASRLLPPQSRIRIRHAGGILEPEYEALVAQEQKENPRYQWLGELSPEGVAGLLASSDLMVLSSHSEGGARVIGESIVHGTPVLATRIDGVVGLLDADYPGFFPTDDAAALAAMLWKSESDPAFYAALQSSAEAARSLFSPESEIHALEEALNKLHLAPAGKSLLHDSSHPDSSGPSHRHREK
jgi:putative glycosyltransferase (TIGR04348 family)